MSARQPLVRSGVAALVLALLFGTLAPTVSTGAPVAPFGARFSTDDNGTVAIFGNNLLTCPASDDRCDRARAGTANLNNNSFAMVNLDADSVGSTFNSSSSDVSAPPDAQVLWAGLYWGARVARGPGGTAGTGVRQQMSLRPPGAAGYTTVSSQASFGPTSGDGAYQEFADVTAVVRAAGEGTYWGGNVVAGTGEDRYAGWSLVVVYRAPSLPLRNMTVFDGFADVGRGEPQQISLSGFRSPLTGPVETQLGMVAYEGDFATSGDNARLNDTLLSTTPLTRGSNFFNGTNDHDGTSVAARTPADLNMLGYDVKNLSASGIPNGASTAEISLESTGDRYFPGVVTTAIGLFAPDFTTSSKSVANLAGRSPALPGDVLEYTLTYPNTGQDPAVDAVVTDTLPAGLSVETVTPSSGTCSAADQVVECVVGTIAVGATWQATVRAVVDTSAAGTTLRNAAVLDYTAATLGRDLTYLVTPAETAVSSLADLSLEKTMSPDPGEAGGEIVASLVVVNDGPTAAQDVTVTDPLPSGATFVSATSDQGSCTFAAPTVTCTLGTVAADATVPIEIVMSTTPSSTATSLVNVATVGSTTADPNPADNSSGASVALSRRSDLEVTKTPTASTVVPGETVTYAVTVRNDGPSDAVDVIATDIPGSPELRLAGAEAPGADCSVSDATARCSVPVLAPGASLVMTVTARVSPDAAGGTTLGNSATGASSTPDPDPSDDSAAAEITVAAPSADLEVEKSVGRVLAGGQATYTVEVTNAGPSTAREVALEDVLPDGLALVSATSSRGTCTQGPTISCALGDLPGPGADGALSSATLTVVADVSADHPGGDVTNTATVTSSTADPDGGDDSASATAPVQRTADVSVAKTADPVQPAAGEDVTFTITASNAGPAVAREVVLTDTLPEGLDLGTVDAPAGVTCDAAGGVLTCGTGDLAVGAQAVVEVTMSIPADFDLDAGAVNAVTVSTTSTDPVTANDSAEATVTTRAVSDLAVLKWDTTPGPTPDEPPRTFTAGEEVTYYLAALNFGPSDAASAVVTDTLPDGVTYVSSVEQCTFAAPVLTCALPTVPDQLAAVFPVVVRVDADLDPGSLLTNTATIELTDPDRVDPSSANNTAVRSNPVAASADLSVTKRTYSLDLPSLDLTIPSAAPAGAPSGYQIDVRNDGPSTARDVVLVDSSTMTRFHVNQVRVVRDGDAEDITDQCSWSGGDLQCPLGDVPPFAAGDASWLVQVDGVTLSDAPVGEYVNTATLTSSTPDADDADNVSQAPLTVTDPVATLELTKDVVGLTDVDGNGEADIVPGAPFGYLLTVANVLDLQREGASDAPDVVVSDTLPDGFVVTSAVPTQGTCTVEPPASVTCELGTVLGPGRVPEPPPVQVTISGYTLPTLAGTPSTTNTATVTSPISADAEASVTTPVVAVVDLSVVKLADAEEFAAGGDAGFSIVVTNAGPSDAPVTEVGDLLPPELTFDPETSDPSCAPVDQGGIVFVACSAGTLAAGETRTVRVGARIDPSQAPTEVVNVGAASSPVAGEYDFDNNRSDVPVRITRSADLVVTKAVDAEAVAAGEEATFTVSVTNAGPSDASDVVIDDALPAGTELVSAVGTDGLTCEESGGTITCTQDLLAPGASATATIVARVLPDTEPGALVNTATASSTTPDPEIGNNEASVTLGVFVLADVAVTKTVLTTAPTAGQPVEFAIDVVNRGPQPAPHLVVSDSLAEGLRFVSAESGGACATTNPEGIDIVTCELGTLAAGSTTRVVVTTLPDADLRSIVNGALVGSAALDEVADDNYDEIELALRAPVVVPPSPPGDVDEPPDAPGDPQQNPVAPDDGGEPAPADDTTPTPDRYADTSPSGLSATGTALPALLLLWGAVMLVAGTLAVVVRGHLRRAHR
ncbi:DUF11 domain-containing protein [Cellulosimicrobium terreum]|nr:DUF11 domain-containing protein [Cellulosimicrobium terreum]